MALPASPPAGATPGPRFTRYLFLLALALGAVALGVRLARGLRTGRFDWLEMTLPAAVVLMLGAILAGPRRARFYYPLLALSFVLLVSFYVLPHRMR